MKYQTNNPFRKNANDTSPLVLLLQVIKLLKADPEENGAGIYRSELSLVICWPNRDATALYRQIKALRAQYGFSYGDEVIYDICLGLLGATPGQRNRFKISQITGEAVDEFIRKMRITGVVSLRGNGRFIDLNSFENSRIDYILETYSDYASFTEKKAFFEYIGTLDPNIIMRAPATNEAAERDARAAALEHWAAEYSKEDIAAELRVLAGRGESQNAVLRLIDKPTRFEFLTSIALKQHFWGLDVRPNYHVDDGGLPTFTASGGVADIECAEPGCRSLVEVTLMCTRNQAINEVPAITRHLNDAAKHYPGTLLFSMLIAPAIHTDTIYMAGYSKYQYNANILPLTISEFLEQISGKTRIAQMLDGGRQG